MNYSLYLRYPARAPLAMSPRLAELQALSPNIAAGVNRTGMGQAMVQLTVLGITLGVSIVAGAFTGERDSYFYSVHCLL